MEASETFPKDTFKNRLFWRAWPARGDSHAAGYRVDGLRLFVAPSLLEEIQSNTLARDDGSTPAAEVLLSSRQRRLLESAQSVDAVDRAVGKVTG
jgi:hypothetical protein